MFGIRYNVNICDNILRDLEIHFTKACDNLCPFCIDRMNKGIDESPRPNVDAIMGPVILYGEHIDYIGIAGGEPCLYIDELYDLCSRIKSWYPKKHINLITSVPETCYKNKETFFKIIELCDSITISPQHHDQAIADIIRGKQSNYDRESFYKELPHKEKINVTINLIRGCLDTLDDVKKCLLYYNGLGFKQFKLCELSKAPTMFVDLEKTLGIKLPSAFAHGCVEKDYDITTIIPDFDGKVSLKRTCFYNNERKKATISDFIKICTRWLFRKKYFFGVVYGNGKVYKYWK